MSPDDASSNFEILPIEVRRISRDVSGVLADATGVVRDLSALSIDPHAFAQLGSPVRDAAQSAQVAASDALRQVLALLGQINQAVDTSAASFQRFDQTTAASYGSPAAGAGPASSLPQHG